MIMWPNPFPSPHLAPPPPPPPHLPFLPPLTNTHSHLLLLTSPPLPPPHLPLPTSPYYYRYDGPTFLKTLDSLPSCERNKAAPLRLPILSKYKDLGTIIEGKVEQGTVSVGDKLCVMPNKVAVEVMNVWLDQDEVCYLSSGGENAPPTHTHTQLHSLTTTTTTTTTRFLFSAAIAGELSRRRRECAREAKGHL